MAPASATAASVGYGPVHKRHHRHAHEGRLPEPEADGPGEVEEAHDQDHGDAADEHRQPTAAASVTVVTSVGTAAVPRRFLTGLLTHGVVRNERGT